MRLCEISFQSIIVMLLWFCLSIGVYIDIMVGIKPFSMSLSESDIPHISRKNDEPNTELIFNV